MGATSRGVESANVEAGYTNHSTYCIASGARKVLSKLLWIFYFSIVSTLALMFLWFAKRKQSPKKIKVVKHNSQVWQKVNYMEEHNLTKNLY